MSIFVIKCDLARLDTLRKKHHHGCVACGDSRYRLDFTCAANNTLIAQWKPDHTMGSYPNTLHGGLQSLLVDEAMTCCLMAHGILGVTADLQIRFKHHITLDAPLEISTRLTQRKEPLYQLQTEIFQNGKKCLLARGKFMPNRQISD